MKKINVDLTKITKNQKIRFITGITLVTQAIVFAVLCVILWGKKRSLAKVFASVAALGGLSGVLLLMKCKKKPCTDKELTEEEDVFGDGFDEDDVFCNFENEDEDCCCGDEAEAGSEA